MLVLRGLLDVRCRRTLAPCTCILAPQHARTCKKRLKKKHVLPHTCSCCVSMYMSSIFLEIDLFDDACEKGDDARLDARLGFPRIDSYLRPESHLGNLGVDGDLMSDEFWHTLREARLPRCAMCRCVDVQHASMYPRHSMGLVYMPISWGGLRGQCRHIWQSHEVFGVYSSRGVASE